MTESLGATLDSQLAAYYDSIPEENRLLLDKTLDFDHDGVQTDLGTIAASMDKWEGRVADELGLSKAEIAAVNRKYPGELLLQTRMAIQKWQEKHGPSATYKKLIVAFVKASRSDYAEAVCNVLRTKDTKPDPSAKDSPPKRSQLSKQYLEPTSAISRYARYLKGVYKHASDEKVPKISCDKFIELALVKKIPVNRSEATKFTKATLHGDIDEILQEKEPIPIEDVLKPNKSLRQTKCVLVLGAPGIGKSTFALEFCRRWDSIEVLKQYSLIVLLRLREKRVQEIQSIAHLFYHYDRDLQDAVAKDVTKSEGRGVLLVLDGFDELPSALRSKSLFVDVIRSICLPHCTIVLTSRPSATVDLYSVAKTHIQKEIEILGFTQERIEEFAASVFASQPDVLSDFLKYIESSPPIRSLMYIPLNGIIVTEIYRANRTTGRPIPQTMTQLYSELCLVLLARHLVDKEDTLAEELPEKLQDLPPQLNPPILALAKLAYDGILHEELIFNKLPNECHGDHYGFMNASTELYMGHKARVSYNFLHLTLQEFLAAFYLSQCPSIELYLLKKVVVEWNIGRFLAGLTGCFTESWLNFFSESKLDSEEEWFILSRSLLFCLYESQSNIDYKSMFGATNVMFGPVVMDESMLFDYYALGQCIAKSDCQWHVHVQVFTSENENELTMLINGLKSCSEVCGSIETLYTFSLNDLDCAQLGEFPPTILQRLSMLCLENTELDYSILANVIATFTQLKTLNISGTVSSEGLVKLFTKLATLRHLEELYVHDIGMEVEDIDALSTVVTKPASYVKKLTIGSESMSSDCVQSLLELVLSPSSLETLRLCSINVKVAHSFRNIANNLLTLELHHCIGIPFILPHLSTSLYTNTSLQELAIYNQNINSDWKEGIVALNLALRHNHSLTKVILLKHATLFCSEWDSRLKCVRIC